MLAFASSTTLAGPVAILRCSGRYRAGAIQQLSQNLKRLVLNSRNYSANPSQFDGLIACLFALFGCFAWLG
jgi:hypothetical protein